MYPHARSEIPPHSNPVIQNWSLERYITEVMCEDGLAHEDAYVAMYLLHTTEIKYALWQFQHPTYLPMAMLCALKVAVALRHFDRGPVQTDWSKATHSIAPPEVIRQLVNNLRSAVFERLKNAVGLRAVTHPPLPRLGTSSYLQAVPPPQRRVPVFTNVPEVDYVHLNTFVAAMMGITGAIENPNILQIEEFLPCKDILPLEYLFRVPLNLSRYNDRMTALLRQELVPASMNSAPNYYRSVACDPPH